MHRASFEVMTRFLSQIAPDQRPGWSVLDVGSYDVNGTFRDSVIQAGATYTGIDIEGGPNVDMVVERYAYPFPDGAFDVVISGSTMEHVPHLWRWIPELARVLKPGGWLALYTHQAFPYHPFPVDCWRILPTGMAALLEDFGDWQSVKIVTPNEQDIFAIAQLRKEQVNHG